METMTTKTTSTAVGSIRINAGTDMAAALYQGSPTQGKRNQHGYPHQRRTTTGIGTSEQQRQGQCHHADRQKAQQDRAAEGAMRARADKYSTQQEQGAEQKLL
jgi:hypothetical protein